MNDFFEIFKDPKKEIFWTAIGVLLGCSTIIGALFVFIYNFIVKNIISLKTKKILDGQVELFLNWVKIISKSQQIDANNVEEWLSNIGGVVNLGRNYKIYEKFILRINKLENLNLKQMNEDKFLQIVKEYDSSPKWSRLEW